MDKLDLFFVVCWLLIALVIVLPSLSSNKDSLKPLSLRDRVFYYLDIVIVALIPFICKWIAPLVTDADIVGGTVRIGAFLLSVAIAILCVYLKHMVELRKEYGKVKETLDNQLDIFTNHPILKNKESMDNVMRSMIEISNENLRKSVRTFFNDSFGDIEKHGAVRINASFSDYTDLLGTFMENAESIIGTFTTRPKEIQRHKDDSSVQRYLKILKQNKDRVQRICVLEVEEIQGIGRDIKKQKNSKPKNRTKGEKNEVEWFLDSVPSKVNPRWDETKAFLEKLNKNAIYSIIPPLVLKMVDFAIFDNILLRWSPDENYASPSSLTQRGAIIVLVGNKAQELRKTLEEYLKDDTKNGFSTFDDLYKAHQSV